MGTRGLTVVKSKGKVKVAQYGQWDHYPSGQGKTIARFIQNEMDLNKFKTRVDKLQFATPKQVDATWVDCGAAPGADFISFSIADDHAVIYPEFSRDTGAEILGLMQARWKTRLQVSQHRRSPPRSQTSKQLKTCELRKDYR